MINGHTECADYLMSCHVPSGGGIYHRAVATIQAAWKYHRYKVECLHSVFVFFARQSNIRFESDLHTVSAYWSTVSVGANVCVVQIFV